MAEINLMDKYPQSRRPLVARGKVKLAGSGRLTLPKAEFATTEDLMMQHALLRTARRFGREYFDGDRLYGYGGYNYDPRFWSATARRLCDHYSLKPGARVLDVGCAKGYLLHDIQRQHPDLAVTGVDISEYAIAHAHPEVRPFVTVADAVSLPFPDDHFDLVVSINTVSNPVIDDCKKAIREIMRVSRGASFITVHAWRTDQQRENILKWNLTARTCMRVDDWTKLFDEVGYTGDYYWSFVE